MSHFKQHSLTIFFGLPLLLCAACASRDQHFTLTKDNVSQAQLLQDEKLLKGTGGVRKVIPRHDSSNTVTLDLYVDEDNSTRGLQAATDLGYQRVRN